MCEFVDIFGYLLFLCILVLLKDSLLFLIKLGFATHLVFFSLEVSRKSGKVTRK